MRNRLFFPYLLLLIVLPFIFGCSGTSNSDPTPGVRTTAAVTIKWPVRSRAIPTNANSIMVKLSDSSGFSTAQIADRPTDGSLSTLTFEVPVGQLFVTAEAYPEAQAAGNPLAVASSVTTTQAGTPAALSMTMQSTVAGIKISSDSQTLNVGEARHLAVTPVDAAGLTVLCPPEEITWTSSVPGVLAVDDYGNIRGMTVGSADITAKDKVSGAQQVLTFTVQLGPDGAPKEAVLDANAVVVPTDGSVSVGAVTGSSVTLGGAAPTLNAGDIILYDKEPYLMVKVVSSQRTRGGDVVVQTVPATIDEAYQELDIDVTKTSVAADTATITPLDSDITITRNSPMSRYGGDITASLLSTNIAFTHALTPFTSVSGSVSIGVSLHFAIKIHLATVDYLKVELLPTVAGTASITSSSGSWSLSYSKEYARVDKKIPVWGPIFVSPTLTLGTEFTLSGTAFKQTTLSGSYGMCAGVEYTPDAGFHGYASKQPAYSSSFNPGTTAVSASATYYPINLSASLLIEGLAGPVVSVGPYSRVIATANSTTSYNLDMRYGLKASAGLTAGLGGIFKSLSGVSASWTWTLADVSSSYNGFPVDLNIDTPTGGGGGGGGSVTPGGVNMMVN